MSSGGGQTSTQTTNNAPPQEYLDAYKAVLGQANQVASTPYQNYPGQLQASFSPQQEAAFTLAGQTIGEQAPYINSAAQHFTDATAPLQPLMQPYVDQAQQYYQSAGNQDLQGALQPYQQASAAGFGNVANTNLSSSIAPAQQAAYQGFASGSQTLTPQQYSQQAIQSFYNPYQSAVVDATQKQFDLSNATQQNQLRGNAASNAALGGDRLGVAQAQLAGQQQTQQAPVIAGLMSQGFGQAQQEFNNQQQTNLTAAQQSAMLKQQAAQGYTALGNQSLTAAQQQAALQAQAAQGFAGLGGQSLTAAQQQAALKAQAGQGIAGLGQAELGAGQSQGWLNAQAGSGMAGLGNEALQGTLASTNALLGTGALQQQQAQTSLNIPYQQWLAAQSYPFQTTGWLSNIAQGLGGASGRTGNSSSTSPGPSAVSQLAGVGALAGAGALYGAKNGWFSGSDYPVAGTEAAAAQGIGAGGYSADALNNTVDVAGAVGGNRGGAVSGFAGGGGVPNVSMNGVNVGEAPGSQSVLAGADGMPDVGASIVPGSSGFGSVPTTGGQALLNRDYGRTSTTEGGGSGDSTIGTILKTAGGIAAAFYGGPAGYAAANALGSQVHFGRGGHVPVLSRGFAAGGAPIINVQTVPNARGVGVPTMNVDQTALGAALAAPDAGTMSPLNAYLSKTAAGAYHPPATPPPAAPVAPPPAPAPTGLGPGFTPNGPNVGDATPSNWSDMDWRAELLRESSGGGGAQARGGIVRGFDGGGDVGDDDEFVAPDLDFGRITNRPAGQHFGDWLHGRARDAEGQEIPTPPAPPTPHDDTFDRPVAQMIPQFLRNAWARQQAHNAAFNAQTARDPEPDPDLYGDVPTARPDPNSLNREFDPLLHGRGTGDGTYPLNQGPAPETHGGGWQPGVSAQDDAPATPAGPNRTTTSGGFGPNGPPGPGVPEPPSGGFAGSSETTGSTGFGSRAGYGDDRSESRALTEDRANPWLSLALAGAGMLSGTSPHAGVNIGQGLGIGLTNYIKTDQAAKELAAKVQDNKARLAESHAYHNDSIGVRRQNADSAALRAQSYAAMQSFKQANPSLTAAGLKTKMIGYWVNQGMSEGEAYEHVQGLDLRQAQVTETNRSHRTNEGFARDRIEIARQGIMNQDDYKNAELELRKQHLSDSVVNNIMTNAVRDRMADPRLSMADAVKAQTAGRATVANPATKKPPPRPADLEAARTAITKGGRDKAAVIQQLGSVYDLTGIDFGP